MMDVPVKSDGLDWRGVKRAGRQFQLRASRSGEELPLMLAEELAAASKLPAEVVITDLSRGDGARRGEIETIAARHGYAVDPGFDRILPPDRRSLGVIRLVPSRWTEIRKRGDGRVDDDPTGTPGPTADQRRIVEALQEYLVGLLEEELLHCAVVPKSDIVAVLNVGSTSRGTYAALPVDFDVTAVTRRHGPEIAIDPVRRMVDRIMARTAESREYGAYCAAAGLDAGGRSAELRLRSLGMRGPESLVGRVSAVWSRDGDVAEEPFLDLSLGALYRPAGYEHWIRRYFDSLDPVAAAATRREIQLAKEILRRDGELYGSSNHAFRGHVVEQMIIQMHLYRHSGSAAGTLSNAFRIIHDEAACDERGGNWRRFAEAFPLWHTGVWEASTEYQVELPPFNLWNLIGDGDEALAEHQWRRLQRCAAAMMEGV